ncbi:glycine cleavage system protein T [Candidatus Termititenax persephonae]|uniref:aminomethyltransferase n=1 Tax=Candidatus Termititenax persephonae TaxID=2218525 RepID=A0A388TH75_9BACT|nr:glycine cleavage system protein T [Candidatus Termititenax persephonae]
MKHTPLYPEHLKLGAKMVEFAGWAMPLQYKSLLEEHKAVRARAGMFDAGHMGVVKFLSAEKLLSAQRRILTRFVDDLAVGQIRYNRIRNAQDGIVDDILVYRDYEHYLGVFNAANTDKDIRHLAENFGVECELLGLHIIAVQGPGAEEIVQRHTEEDLGKLKYYTFIPLEFQGFDVLAAKTGYTGERGFELLTPAENCAAVWRVLWQDGVVPCGLGARDTLRIEAGMPLYGQELRETWTSDQSDGIVGLKILDKFGVPRQGYQVYDDRERLIGEITSGTFSPTLNEPVAMAYLEKQDPVVFVKIRDKMARAQIVSLPFYSKVRKTGQAAETREASVPERGQDGPCACGHD